MGTKATKACGFDVLTLKRDSSKDAWKLNFRQIIWADGKAQPGRNSDVEKVRGEKLRDGEDER